MIPDISPKRDWQRIVRRLEQLLRLRSFPVAFKLLEDERLLSEIPFLRRPSKKYTLCQLINIVRNFDWTVGAVASDFISPVCGSIIGLSELPWYYWDGTFRSIVWVQKKADAIRYERSIYRIPYGRYRAVAMAPLVYNPFEPDLVLIYANPAQMMLLINSLQFEDYEPMEFSCVGESSCSDVIARSYLTNKPALSIPCYGERRYGHAQDDELSMAIPSYQMEKALRGMEALYRRGVRYPISFAGAEEDLKDAFPHAYKAIETLKELRGEDKRLLVGITGGIATGKSTVVKMLKEKGAYVIDFDLLAREVVRPGMPAYKDIVDYFGTQILAEDKTIDRKKLGQIVFQDLEKKKKLESFTHPRIHERFVEELRAITVRDQEAIILADIPLLIEQNLQYIFHKVILVYIPEEIQLERLMERDKITKEQALSIIRSQLPIDEKVGYADYVIDNSGSLSSTQSQVDRLWAELKELQAQKTKA